MTLVVGREPYLGGKKYWSFAETVEGWIMVAGIVGWYNERLAFEVFLAYYMVSMSPFHH